MKTTALLTIPAPNFKTQEILIEGTAPLVIARFSKKAELMQKMAEGKAAKSKKERSARDYDKEADEARYYNSDHTWQGVNASGFRAGMISACRLVGFKMTLAKLSVFILEEDFAEDRKTPLVRIYGDSFTDTSHTRNATGVIDIRSRPIYPKWASVIRVRFDEDQFTTTDIMNLVARVGMQVGIGEGRPDSKSSTGCGWGTFRIVSSDEYDWIKSSYGIA